MLCNDVWESGFDCFRWFGAHSRPVAGGLRRAGRAEPASPTPPSESSRPTSAPTCRRCD